MWAVMVSRGCGEEEGGAGELRLPCLLGVSAESVVLIERCSRRVVFNCSCRDVVGWKAVMEAKEGGPSLDIFYERGESVSVSVAESQAEDIREVVQRLEVSRVKSFCCFLINFMNLLHHCYCILFIEFFITFYYM